MSQKGLMVMIRTCAIMTAVLLLACSVAGAVDLDEDGLQDEIETLLINRHAPWLLYNSNENNFPSTVTWKIKHSTLVYCDNPNGAGCQGEQLVYSNEQLVADPSRIIRGDLGWASSSTIVNQGVSGYRLDLDNNWQGGEGPLPRGMYAHVVSRGPQILLQFWQFFPFNDDKFWDNWGIDNGDHEGDWAFLDLYLSGVDPYPVDSMVYHHHGDSNCSPTALPRMWPLPSSGIPDCYLEEGSHEWWPFAGHAECDDGLSGTIWESGNHDGLGERYRASGISNLGERFAPMPGGENELILFFNGRWGKWGGIEGEPAQGPINQAFGPIPPLAVAYVSGASAGYTGLGLGSRYHPFSNLEMATNSVELSGEVRIAAYHYPGAFLLRRPTRFTVWGAGRATIGR